MLDLPLTFGGTVGETFGETFGGAVARWGIQQALAIQSHAESLAAEGRDSYADGYAAIMRVLLNDKTPDEQYAAIRALHGWDQPSRA